MINDIVVLIHGYNKDQSDMFTLDQSFSQMGYTCVSVDLPTRYGSLDECTDVLQRALGNIQDTLVEAQKVHFVGHSMGGLIIRNYLAKINTPFLGRCVFIASPNKGSKLADLVHKMFPPAMRVFRPLNDLRTNVEQFPQPINIPFPEIGVIAGNRSNLLLGVFLPGENDGRVEVDSTRLTGMKDFIVKHYGHKEIHHQLEVAILINNFLQTGSFQLERLI